MEQLSWWDDGKGNVYTVESIAVITGLKAVYSHKRLIRRIKGLITTAQMLIPRIIRTDTGRKGLRKVQNGKQKSEKRRRWDALGVITPERELLSQQFLKDQHFRNCVFEGI